MAGRESVSRLAGRYVVPRLPALAPDLNASFVREALDRAIHGIGPLAPAAVAAERRLRDAEGHARRALDAIVDDHVRYAGAQGLLTSVGGALTAVVTVPTNITGLALIQTRMVSAIAHLRGYDLDDPRVQDAVLACLLGEARVDALVRDRKIPAPPMALATAPAHDPDTHRVLAAEVTAELVAKVGGKRAAVAFTRKVPIVGGVVGMGVDGFDTWRIGDYAGSELRPRARR
ncbi:EcsC family protein [Nocardioides sp. YIM 152315]|uniref:EcsC family protein n=1 Tax=Nocardioides sp. YIM 152315 TaxID=3031760 RepID=UPI0023DB57D6|nr:EcsC family protein [Nocardioides sp. YIM 152315]MDF1604606.1 EcsC family protein [Nocardioides sp. YIM 152315]